MYYENAETKTGFLVWNSRDGVTPFIVFEDGKEYQHNHWGLDRQVTNKEYIKNQILVPGQRVFRDTNTEEAKESAIRRLQSAKGTQYEVEEGSEKWHDLVASLAKNFLTEPSMVKVKEDKTY